MLHKTPSHLPLFPQRRESWAGIFCLGLDEAVRDNFIYVNISLTSYAN